MNNLSRSGLWLAAFIATFGLGGMACAGGDPGASAPLALPLDGEVTNPDWRVRPSGDDMEREYPRLASLMGMAGGAAITCQVEVDGHVDDCHVTSEWPAGMGFGAAAVRMSAYFAMKPATLDGRPVPGLVTVPLKFRMGDGAQRPADAASIPPPTSPGALEAARKVVVLEDVAGRLHTQWRSDLDRMTAQAALAGDAQSGAAAADAFRQGLDEVIGGEVDRRAQWMAAKMTRAELEAVAVFLTSPAGRDLTKVSASVEETVPMQFMINLRQAARAHLCAQVSCESPSATPSSTAAAPSG